MLLSEALDREIYQSGSTLVLPRSGQLYRVLLAPRHPVLHRQKFCTILRDDPRTNENLSVLYGLVRVTKHIKPLVRL
jgi:hypothetical protein